MSNTTRSTYRFARLPEWILYHPNLNGTDIRVFCALDRYDGRDCFPSHESLAERIGVSVDTTQRSIKRLEAVGAIVIEKRSSSQGRTSNRYYLAGDIPLDKDEATRRNAVNQDRIPAAHHSRRNAARSRAIDPEQVDPTLSHLEDVYAEGARVAEREQDFLQQALAAIVPLLVAKRDPVSAIGYQIIVERNLWRHTSPLDLLHCQYPDLGPQGLAALYVQGNKSGVLNPAAKPAWEADLACDDCAGDGWRPQYETGDLEPCPCRKIPS